MLKNIFFSILFLILISTMLISQNINAKIDYIKGKAEVKRAGSTAWEPLSAGMTVTENDTVKTYPLSLVDLKFDDKTFGRIAASSEVKLEKSEESVTEMKKLFFKKKMMSKKINLKINKGRLLSKVGSLNDKSTFKVTTPVAVVGVRGTIFDAAHGSQTTVKVLAGRVSVVNPAVSMTPVVVAPGQITSIATGKMPAPPRAMTSSEASDVSGLMSGSSTGGSGEAGAAAPGEAEVVPTVEISPVAPNTSSITEAITSTITSPTGSVTQLIQAKPLSKIRVNVQVK